MADSLKSNNQFLTRLFEQDPSLVGELVPDNWSVELSALEFAGAVVDLHSDAYPVADAWFEAVLASGYLTVGKLRKAVLALSALQDEARENGDETYGQAVEFARAILLVHLATAAFRWSIK